MRSIVIRVLANGCTSAAFLYVTVRGYSVPPTHVGFEPGHTPIMSVRRPPGFITAMSAVVAHRWTSATWLPNVDSPPRFSEVPLLNLAREKPALILPRGRAPSTAALLLASVTIAWVAASPVAGNCANPMTSWVFARTSPVALSTLKTSLFRFSPYWPAETTGRSLTARSAHAGTGTEWL